MKFVVEDFIEEFVECLLKNVVKNVVKSLLSNLLTHDEDVLKVVEIFDEEFVIML